MDVKVHIAGPVINGVQRCMRCFAKLGDAASHWDYGVRVSSDGRGSRSVQIPEGARSCGSKNAPALTFGALSYDSHGKPYIRWFDSQGEAEAYLAGVAQCYLEDGQHVPHADDWGIVKLVKSGSMKRVPFDREYFQMEAVNG